MTNNEKYICKTCGRQYELSESLSSRSANQRRFDLCHVCRGVELGKKSPSRKDISKTEVRSYILDLFGSRCCRCGYGEFVGVLEFHHVNPTTKKSGIHLLVDIFCRTGDISDWGKLTMELCECILLCSNCHRAWHRRYWKDATAYGLTHPSRLVFPPFVLQNGLK